VMICGLILYVVAVVFLLASPMENWLWVAGFVVIDACASALFLPRMRSLAAHEIEPEERARIRSLFYVVVLAVSTPFGYLAGRLADIDLRWPFVLILGVFVCMLIFTLVFFRLQYKSEKTN